MANGDIHPPDLEMRVRVLPEDGKTRLSYTLHSPSGAAPFSHFEISGPVLPDLNQFHSYLFAKIERLTERLDVGGEPLLLVEIARKLANLGQDLARELFPSEFWSAYRTIRKTVRTWMIISDDPRFYWELVKPFDNSTAELIDDDFLGLQYELTHWLPGVRTAAPEIPVRRLAAISMNAGLPQAGIEQASLQQLAARAGVEDASFSPSSAEELVDFLRKGGTDLLHFIGHSYLAGQADDTPIPLQDGSSFRPTDLEGPIALRISRDRSLIFLNVCLKNSRARGWAWRWISVCGCGAFVAPHWPVSDRAASEFSQAFYEALWRGAPLGRAARETREHLRSKGSLDALRSLAYTIYGNPSALVLFGEKATAPLSISEKIIPFGPLIQRKTEGFVGRQWLFDAIDGFVAATPRGYVHILGSPGIGKTSVIAEMVRRYGHPHHFNVRSAGIQRPEHFLPSLCAQLVARFRLGDSVLPPEVSRDGSVLANFLEKAAAKLRPAGSKLLILVDALDESDPSAVTRGSNILYLPSDLPDGVFFVVTSRRGGPVLRTICPEHTIDLEVEDESNFADVRLFAESWLGREGIQAYIRDQGLDGPTFVNEISRLSEGNFMYLAYVLPEIERGTYKDRKLTELPTGLQNHYEDHWIQMRGEDRNAWNWYKLPILVALTIAKEPISIDLIADFSGVEKRSQIRAVLEEWAPFLQASESEEVGAKEMRWRLYHDSFHDFIASKDQIQDALADLKATNRKSAEALWSALYPETQGAEAEQAAFRLEKIEIRNFKNISNLELDFNSPSSLRGEWDCIAGINGSGKTAILQAISLAFLGPQLVRELGGERLRRMLRQSGGELLDAEIYAHVLDAEGQRNTVSLLLNEQSILSELELGGSGPAERLRKQVIVAYGASRNLSNDQEDRYRDLTLRVRRQMTLFDPRARLAGADVLLESGPSNAPPLQMLRQILATVLADELTPRREMPIDRLVFNQSGSAVEAIDLPDGFRSTLAWLADLCAAWYETKPSGRFGIATPADIRAIVLLDEIDLHLHPSLQRTLVPRLRKALPNVQFIVTTHSPLVLSSFDRSELIILDQTAEGGVRYLDRQIFGFSADEVYEWLMGTKPLSTVLEQKLLDKDDPDLALYFYQSTERSEDQARADLEERRLLIEKVLGPQAQ